MKTAPYLPLLLCLCIGDALAGTPIQLQHAASATARISVSNIAGSVNVTAWDRNEIQVGGELGEGAKPLQVTGDNDHLSIKVESRGGSGWFNFGGDSRMAPTTLELRVPRAASLDVDVVSAPLTIDGLAGGDIKVNTISGNARINARTPSVDVDSVSGSIELSGHAERAALQTVSGEILAPALGSKAKLETISGGIQVGGGPWQTLTLSTVSGDVQLSGGLASGGGIDVDSMSGDVQLRLPADTSAKLHASSFSGDLRSDFGTPIEADHGPGSSLDARLGGGNGKIRIETFSGDLRVRKLD
ncbi:MAG TPA: DUF4097 family beta strand repeat-containing protein [Rhodanobacter sp.]|nr:DUF4097 family beta strand repeat-containing protein [Rhodanobacter sp.]